MRSEGERPRPVMRCGSDNPDAGGVVGQPNGTDGSRWGHAILKSSASRPAKKGGDAVTWSSAPTLPNTPRVTTPSEGGHDASVPESAARKPQWYVARAKLPRRPGRTCAHPSIRESAGPAQGARSVGPGENRGGVIPGPPPCADPFRPPRGPAPRGTGAPQHVTPLGKRQDRPTGRVSPSQPPRGPGARRPGCGRAPSARIGKSESRSRAERLGLRLRLLRLPRLLLASGGGTLRRRDN